MISVPDTLHQRVTSAVLCLYIGAFLSQALCVLHASNVESGMDGPPAVHALAPMANHGSSHSEHSDATGHDHSGGCAVVACGSAITAADHNLGPVDQVSKIGGVYHGGTIPPDTEMVPPPPRLG